MAEVEVALRLRLAEAETEKTLCDYTISHSPIPLQFSVILWVIFD